MRSDARQRFSLPRTPSRDELLLTRLTHGFVPSTCLPLTSSRSRFRLPYRRTVAICACTAGASAAAYARITTKSDFFIRFVCGPRNRRRPCALSHVARPGLAGRYNRYALTLLTRAV